MPMATIATTAAAATGHQARGACARFGPAPTARRAAAAIAASSAGGGWSRLAARHAASTLGIAMIVGGIHPVSSRSCGAQVGKLGTQFGRRVAQSALDRLGADAGQRRDFLERQAALLLQQEGVALGGRQRRDRILEPRAELAVRRARFRFVPAACGQRGDDLSVVFVIGGDQRNAAAGAMVVDQAVVGERVQPGREFGAGLVGSAHADQIHPHVLEKLLGDAGVAALAQQIAIDAALVPRIDRVERRGIAGGIGEHQVFVAGVGAVAHGAASMPAGLRAQQPRASGESRARPPRESAWLDAAGASDRRAGVGRRARRIRIQRGSGVNRPRSGNGSGCQRATRGTPTGTPCASRF